MAYKHIEKPVMKKDAMNLLLGKPVYVDDITSQDCLVVKVLRSPHAHALIEEIDVSKAQKPQVLKLFIRIKMFLKNVLPWQVKHLRNQVLMIV